MTSAELRERVRRLVMEVLRCSTEALTFDEIYRAVSRYVNLRTKYIAREVLAELVRSGKVLRVPLYDRRRMGFKIAEAAIGEA